MTPDKDTDSPQQTSASDADGRLHDERASSNSGRREDLHWATDDEIEQFYNAAAPALLETPDSIQHRRSLLQLIGRFLALTKGQRGRIAVALSMFTVAALLALIPPASTKLVFDVLSGTPLPELVPSDPWYVLLFITIVVLMLAVLRLVVQMFGEWYATLAAIRLQLSVRTKVFQHAMRLPLDRLHDLKAGGVVSVLQQDAACIIELANNLFLKPWGPFFRVMGTLIILAVVDFRMLVGTLVLIPPIYILNRTWANHIRPQHRDIHNQRQKIDGHVAESFSGIRMVRAFSRQLCEASRFAKNNHVWARRNLRVWWWSHALSVMFSGLILFSSSAVLLYGGWQVIHGNLSVGDLSMFLVYVIFLLQPVAILTQSATQVQTSLASFERILDLFDEPEELLGSTDALSIGKDDIQGRVNLRNVRFRYPGANSDSLQEINLDVEPGQTVALVGRSGAGKTTICNLVARFYDPTEGEVLLDGRDLRAIDVKSYRSLLGVVEQDVFLFDGTVAENIGYAKRNASRREIEDAAAVANADEFIRQLPLGYETVIGEQGTKLSGGQRQRLAIARAVLADPKILILDEATSNLDSHSESLIQESLQELMRERTCFVIAHRLSTIAHADCILVFEGGRIVERGTQQELMGANGKYQEMVFAQIEVMSPLLKQRFAHDS